MTLTFNNTKIKKNEHNIPEPVDGIPSFHKIEVVFVPLLAYDKQGQRVGTGFYDKFLAECSPATVKIDFLLKLKNY
jgi:5-formyltetrahydrofolate cyclo-ligase